MNLNDMKGAVPEVKRSKPAKAIIYLIVYNLMYTLSAYMIMNHLSLSEMLEHGILLVLTLISIAAIVKVGIKILPQKNAPHKGLIYMCAIAPIGVIIDWVIRTM